MHTQDSPGQLGRPPGSEMTLQERPDGLSEVAPGEWQPTAVKPIHETLVDLVLANPGATAGELAYKLQRHPVTVRLYLRSDLFRELYARRKGQVVDPILTAKVEDLMESVIGESIEVVGKRVAESQDFELAVRALSAIGPMSRFGAKTAQPLVQTNFIVPMPPRAESSAAWEAQAREVSHGG
jgi:hypothetical protein